MGILTSWRCAGDQNYELTVSFEPDLSPGQAPDAGSGSTEEAHVVDIDVTWDDEGFSLEASDPGSALRAVGESRLTARGVTVQPDQPQEFGLLAKKESDDVSVSGKVRIAVSYAPGAD